MNRVAHVAFICCCVTAFVTVPVARAQDWPPLQAEERGNSQTANVLGVPFTTGYFSYWVRAYRANRVHYSKSNYLESRSWLRGVGPDGVTTSSPERLNRAPASLVAPGALSQPNAAIPTLPLAKTPALPQLPALPQVAPLSRVRPLSPLASNTLPPIPSLSQPSQSLPPLPRLNP